MENATIHAGFVLVGGRSSRMGRDKALIPMADTVLADRVATEVERAAGSVALVGPPERYEGLGRIVIPDLRPGMGPLAGIETALLPSKAEWNLVVACDMPNLRSGFLREMLERAATCGAECLVASSGEDRPEPLCAVWNRSCGAVVSRALDQGRRKTRDLLKSLRVAYWQPAEKHWFVNLNTPAEWTELETESPPERAGKTGECHHG